MTAKDKISVVFDRIQHLDVQPTKHNVDTLAVCLTLLQEVYQEMNAAVEPQEKAGEENG